MPFGPFADFSDCLSRMADRYPDPETRRKVCGALQSRLGEKSEQGHLVFDLPDGAKSEWMDAYLESLEKNDEPGAAKVAWASVYRRYEKNPNGQWTFMKPFAEVAFKSLIKQDRIIYGTASVAIVDSENDLITESALKTAFNSYITRGEIMFYHKNIPVGRVLPSYTGPDGKTYKSGVTNGKLDIVVRINKDTQIANDVWQAIEKGELRAFSIGGQVIGDTVKVCQNEDCSQSYNRVDHIDLHEISIVPNPANDASYFVPLIKSKVVPMTETEKAVDYTGNWDACVEDQRAHGADNPEAVCAAIKNRTVQHAMKWKLAKSDDEAKSLVREWAKHPFSNYHLQKEIALERLIRDEKNQVVNCPGFTEKALRIINGEDDMTETKVNLLDLQTLKEAIVKEVLEGIKKQPAPMECPEGQHMVDGECVPMKEATAKENPMPEETKKPETAEKKPEEKAAPVPAAAEEVDPAKAEIDSLRDSLKERSETLNALNEKVSGLALSAEVKGQVDVLKQMIEQNKALAEALVAAQPPAPIGKTGKIPMTEQRAVDMTYSSHKPTIEERAAKFARQWGIEEKEEEDVPLAAPKPEEDPVKAELGSLRNEFRQQQDTIKSIADKLTGLVETLSRNPAAPVAPAPAGPVLPVVSKEKKSISSESDERFVDWDSDMNHGKSIVERAQLLEQKWAEKENA